MSAPRLRLIVLATPRSGNTWMRHLLRDAFALEQAAVHTPDDLDWDNLPERLVVQLHWGRTPELEARLERHGFRLVGVQRHPLDTLTSILHISLHDVKSESWLASEAGDESGIVGATPRSPAFLDYATGPRAAALFGVNHAWHDHPRRFNVTYEELLANPVEALGRLVEWVGEPAARPLGEVIERNTLAKLRQHHHGNRHFWQGQAGLWRSLYLPAEAERIAWAQRASFDRFGYVCDPDRSLSELEADRNWVTLIRDERKRDSSEALSARRDAAESVRAARLETEDARRQAELALGEAEKAHHRAGQVLVEADQARQQAALARHEVDLARQEIARCQEQFRAQLAESERLREDGEAVRRHLQAELARVSAESADTRGRLDDALRATAAHLAAARDLATSLAARVENFERLGARPLALLRRWARFRDGHPRLMRVLRRVTK